MANVKFGKFEWNPAGYKTLKNSGAIQGVLKNKAQAVANTANASVEDNGFYVKQVTGRRAGDIIHIVSPGSPESMYENAKHNTLLKALGSAK